VYYGIDSAVLPEQFAGGGGRRTLAYEPDARFAVELTGAAFGGADLGKTGKTLHGAPVSTWNWSGGVSIGITDATRLNLRYLRELLSREHTTRTTNGAMLAFDIAFGRTTPSSAVAQRTTSAPVGDSVGSARAQASSASRAARSQRWSSAYRWSSAWRWTRSRHAPTRPPPGRLTSARAWTRTDGGLTLPAMLALTSPNAATPLAFTELPSLPLRPHQVRLSVRAVGVNPVDWKMREYEFLGVMQRLLGPRGPLVVGIDVAGVVTEVGPGVQSLAIGDRVVAATDFTKGERGSYAEEAVVTEANTCKLPEGLPFDVAAALPVAGVTAWMALHETARIAERSASRVLVLGASGGVGHLTVQIAHHAGAAVVGVCSGRNAAWVTSLGATVVDYSKADVLAELRAMGQFDAIVDGVGSATYPRAACIAMLKADGVLVQVVPRAPDLPFLALPGRTHTVLGRATRERLGALVDGVSEGWLAVRIGERIPLAEAERAHDLSRAGRVVGKLVLTRE